MQLPMLDISLLKYAISVARWSEIYGSLSKEEKHSAVMHIYTLLYKKKMKKESVFQTRGKFYI